MTAQQESAHRKLSETFGRRPGVRGIGLVTDEHGDPLIRINVDADADPVLIDSIPRSMEGIRVQLRRVGRLRAFGG